MASSKTSSTKKIRKMKKRITRIMETHTQCWQMCSYPFHSIRGIPPASALLEINERRLVLDREHAWNHTSIIRPALHSGHLAISGSAGGWKKNNIWPHAECGEFFHLRINIKTNFQWRLGLLLLSPESAFITSGASPIWKSEPGKAIGLYKDSATLSASYHAAV